MVLIALSCLLYLIVAFLCFRAWQMSGNGDRRSVWLAVGILFVALAIVRGAGLEDLVRDSLREALRKDGEYSSRRRLQAPVAVAALLVFAAAAFGIARHATRIGRKPSARLGLAAMIAGLVMAALLFLRVISLHAIDAVLYRGLHLNWFIDGGATLLAGWASWSLPKALKKEAEMREATRLRRSRSSSLQD